jgi:hypothetical protein
MGGIAANEADGESADRARGGQRPNKADQESRSTRPTCGSLPNEANGRTAANEANGWITANEAESGSAERVTGGQWPN